MADDDSTFLQVILDVPEPLADAACGLAMRAAARGVEVRDSDTFFEDGSGPASGRAQVVAWLTPETNPESLSAEVVAALHQGDPGAEVAVAFSTVAAEDWVQKVREQVKPVRVGRRIRIRASWHPSEDHPDLVELQIDPGLAFGTGSHATTALCIEAVEDVVDSWRRDGRVPSVLDVGSGSGVLSIVAARLGAQRCLGIDSDPMAVKVAGENAARNDVAERCEFTTDPPDTRDGLWDLVVANIQLGVLTDLAPTVAPRVAPGGDLFLSGLLENQCDEAEAAYVAQGLTPVRRSTRDGWARVHLRRPRL